MAKFERFEDIQAWQKARQITRMIYEITGEGLCAKDFGLRDPIRRASVSIMANIAEEFGRRSNKEFANFLNLAHGSAAEVQSHLYVALDLSYINEETFSKIYDLTSEVPRMIQALSNRLREYDKQNNFQTPKPLNS